MEILNQFGFDLKLFIGQVVNFLVLFYVFKRFLYKPILNVLAERENRIKQGLEDSDRARLLMEESRRDASGILKETRIEAEGIIENSRKMAEQMRQEIVAHSRVESEKIIAQAQAQATLEMEKMQGNLRNISVELSQRILLNVIRSVFSEDEKAKIMQRALGQIEADRGEQHPIS
jgi:F-type H+-transporting ATPase subunit b